MIDERLLARPHVREEVGRALAELGGRPLNFDPRALGARPPGEAWHVDDYCRELPGESPGPPVPGGSFEVTQRLMTDYEFADRRVIRAVYDPEIPLEGRNMLLEIRFWLMRFRVGVRIETVRDEITHVDGKDVRVWGWAYRTLEGHLERGQMDYAVWKWLDSGEVEFRIHAVSEIADIRNPFVRMGFRLVGRRQQIRFARRCGERMARFASAVQGGGTPPRPAIIEGLALSPTDEAA